MVKTAEAGAAVVKTAEAGPTVVKTVETVAAEVKTAEAGAAVVKKAEACTAEISAWLAVRRGLRAVGWRAFSVLSGVVGETLSGGSPIFVPSLCLSV